MVPRIWTRVTQRKRAEVLKKLAIINLIPGAFFVKHR